MTTLAAVPDAETVTYRDTIRDLIDSGEYNPDVIADKVIPTLTDAERDELVRAGVIEAARSENRKIANGAVARVSRAPADQPRDTRWERARPAVSNPHLWPVNPTGRRGDEKAYGDCTRPEVEQMAALYRTREAQLRRRGDLHEKVCQIMHERSLAFVREVPADTILSIAQGAES